MANSNLVAWVARVGLVAFGVWTAWIVADKGFANLIDLIWSEAWASQMFVDLAIALSLFLVWVVGDAKRRGLTAWPFLVLTLLTGSIGPLLYFSLYGTAPRGSAPTP